MLGLYSARPGSVSPSGWQTVIGEITETQYVDWIPSGASIFRREVFRQNLFDDAFDSYSYLEDLDLSYTISRIGGWRLSQTPDFVTFRQQEAEYPRGSLDITRCATASTSSGNNIFRFPGVISALLYAWQCPLAAGWRAGTRACSTAPSAIWKS